MPPRPTTITRVDAVGAPLAAAAALIAQAYGQWAAPVAVEKVTGPSPHGSAEIWIAGDDGGALRGLAVACGAYLRLLAVDVAWRGQGLGSQLLQAVEASRGATTLHVHAEPGNYLQPGVDANNTELRGWLARRGFREGASCRNLRVPLHGAGAPTTAALADATAAIARHGVTISLAQKAQRLAALPLIANAFSAAWAHECGRAKALWLATTANGELVGFSATGGNNAALNWFGPAGTLPAWRGRGVGTALLLAALCPLAATQGGTVIAWTDADEFYRKACGAQAMQHFVAMRKSM